MTRPQRYLTRIIIFLLAVAVVGVVLAEPLTRAFLANPALNGLIGGTLLIGILFSIRQVAGLKGEVRWIEQYRDTESVSDVRQSPTLLAPMAVMLGEERQASLSPMSMRTLLDGIAARMDETRDITRYLIGLLIFLGLLGTFWGLLGTIGAITDTIKTLSVDSSDIVLMFDELKQGLEAPLSGMGTAFSSSLFGLAGSVVLGFIDLQTGQAQNRFYQDLEDWLSSITKLSRGGGALGEGDQSVPSYISALLEQTAESLDSLQRTVKKSEEGRGEVNAAIMALSERLETLTDQRKAEQDLLVKLVEAQNESRNVMAHLAQVLEENAERTAGGMDEATRGHLRNIDVHVKHMMEETAKGRDQFLGDIRSELKLLARTLGGALDETRARTNRPAPASAKESEQPGRQSLTARRDDKDKG